MGQSDVGPRVKLRQNFGVLKYSLPYKNIVTYCLQNCNWVCEIGGVISVIPNRMLSLHTTRSWDFMGLSRDAVGGPVGGDVIVALLDTGTSIKLYQHTHTYVDIFLLFWVFLLDSVYLFNDLSIGL